MKFILRIFGTWFLGAALVLVVIDGAKTLAANTITITSFAEMWQSLNEQSWAAVNTALTGAAAAAPGQAMMEQVFTWPSWAILGAAGVVLLLMGRKRVREQYIATR